MDLSIVIVNWNTIEMLRECLQSTYDGMARSPDVDFEVIVVDNASTDGSAEMVAAEFPAAVLIRNDENRGFAAANNQGFDVAKGRLILLLNSDTIVHGEVLGASVRYIDADARIGAMGCRVLNTDGSVQLTCSQFPTLTNQFLQASGLWKLKRPRWFGRYLMTDWLRDSEREVEVISGCYMLVKKSLMDEVGYLDEDFFFFGEETDWCLRMRKAGWRLMFAPVGEITHHGGGSVRRLNHKRDIMLTGAKVRLHRKHGGMAPAAICWLIGMAFNTSRAVFWSLRGAVAASESARSRARHFRQVTLGLIKL